MSLEREEGRGAVLEGFGAGRWGSKVKDEKTLNGTVCGVAVKELSTVSLLLLVSPSRRRAQGAQTLQ